MNAPVLLSLSEALARLQAEPELFVVYDANVAWVASQLTEALPVRASMALETSEEGKTLETVQALERWLLQEDASRGALLLAVGGGITTDLVGFAAAIYKRGIRYANVPTTLLAQVDAAIGGKTGVNLDGYKNMLGAFRMPECTVLEAAFLRTLPAREFRCGLAELLKTFLIGDGPAYAALVSSLKLAQNEDEEGKKGTSSLKSAQMEDDIRRAAAIKAQIVTEDPEEHGIRAKLNLGHTFGHAIEHAARQKGADITHGEAVAMGILLAAELSERLGVAQKGLSAQLKADFSCLGLPVGCPYPVEDLVEALRKDKKAVTGGKVKFVLLRAPGDVVLQELPYDCYLHTK
ncbi:MAG: 3-dehydroquinate synthase [Candidatus Cryptobacteroides sp.]|nr:3-dehydroquinate synthase [Candidatus Cryptobacteroides sp.]